jgi:hypothetical protein
MNDMWQDAMVVAFRETVRRLALFLPKFFALVSFLLIGLAAGWLVKAALLRVLKSLRFDVLCDRLGLTRALAKAGIKVPVSALVGRVSFWLIFLVFALMGIDALDLPATANLMTLIIGFLPHVLAAVVLLLIGLILANFVAEAVLIAAVNAQVPEARLIANLLRWGILIFTMAMVLTQLGIAKEIVVAAFSITFGGIALALAIALGLGGQNIARDALERRRQKKMEEDEILHI